MLNIKTLESDLHAGRISRREFIKTATLFGLATTLPGLANVASAAPKNGGKLTVGLGHGSTTDTLDPGIFDNDFTIGSSFIRYNFLTEIDANGSLIPELAESWEATPDAKVWTFTMRKGVEFHNGKSMTPQDVVVSIQHHLGKASTSAAKPLLEAITDIKADGDKVIFTLEAGNADLPLVLSDYHIPVMPTVDGKPDWQSAIGTGPYIQQVWEPGVRAAYKRNPNYWKAGRAHFDELEILSIADVAARTNALVSGQLDFMDRCETKTAHLLSRRPGIKVEEASGNAHYTFPMRTDLAPFDNNDVRLALKYALDREALLRAVLHGYGYLGNDHPIGRGQQYFAKDLPQRSYDPDKAKFHLKQAGLSKLNLDVKASEAAFGGGVDAAVLYKEHAAKAGININVIREPADGYWSNVWLKDRCGMCESYWSGRPSEDIMFSTTYASGAEWNESAWENAEFNRLLKAARSELDTVKRREMYYEMQRLVRDEGGAVVPVFNNFVHAFTDKLTHGLEVATNWPNDGHRYVERWWFV